jgi:hypothetical protein
MDDSKRMQEEARVLRWGGLAGVLGSIIFIAVFAIVGLFVGADPAEPEGFVIRHPDIRAARIAENSLYLLALVLWIPHFLALYRALRPARLAPAYFGSVLGILGLVLLAAGALVHVATGPISDLYHAPGATPEEQATLVLIWQATEGILDALLVTGLLLAPTGLIGLGLAMLEAPQFGKGFGGLSVGLGALGIAAASALLVTVSPIAIVTVAALIVFHLAVGWKLYNVARTFEAGSERAIHDAGMLVDTR